MRLKYIATVSFQKSEATNFLEVSKKRKWRLDENDVVCFISRGQDQIVFIHVLGAALSDRSGALHKVVHSERLRLLSGSWNPLMLANYASEVGIKLDGVKRFEQHYRALLDDPLRGRRG